EEINARILTLGRHTLPEGLFRYINGLSEAPSLDEATAQLARYTLLPKALLRDRPYVERGLHDLIEAKRILYYNEAQGTTVWDLFFTDETPWGKDRRGANVQKRRDLAKNVLRQTLTGVNYKDTAITPDIARRLREGLQQALQEDKFFADDFEPIIGR